MPLPDDQQRVLDQIEHALMADDPRFASRMMAEPTRSRLHRRLLVGASMMIGGLVLVIAAAWSGHVWVSVAGFAGMVAGGAFAERALGHRGTTKGPEGSSDATSWR